MLKVVFFLFFFFVFTAPVLAEDAERKGVQRTDYVFPVIADRQKNDVTNPARFSPDLLPDYAQDALKIIHQKRPPRYVAEQAALLKGADGREYLIVVWDGCDDACPRAEFHEISHSADGRMKIRFLREIIGGMFSLDILEPTGQTVFEGEPPVAVMFYGSGGSGFDGYYIHVIQMKRNTVDILPKWVGRPVDLVDLDQDGNYELVTMMPQWRAFYDSRGAAGPHIPVIFRRQNGEFVPACRDFHALYEKYIEKFPAPDGARWGDWEGISSIVLQYIQIGDLDKARSIYTELLQSIETHISSDDKYYGDTLERTKKAIGPFLGENYLPSNDQCLLLSEE